MVDIPTNNFGRISDQLATIGHGCSPSGWPFGLTLGEFLVVWVGQCATGDVESHSTDMFTAAVWLTFLVIGAWTVVGLIFVDRYIIDTARFTNNPIVAIE